MHYAKLAMLVYAPWTLNTNMEAVMFLILDKAFGHNHGVRRCTSQVTRPKDKRIMAVNG